jgi:hypothetical protein
VPVHGFNFVVIVGIKHNTFVQQGTSDTDMQAIGTDALELIQKFEQKAGD